MCKRTEGADASRCESTALSPGSLEELFCAWHRGWGPQTSVTSIHAGCAGIGLCSSADPLSDHLSANLMPLVSGVPPTSKGLYVPKEGSQCLSSLPITRTFTRALEIHTLTTAWLPCNLPSAHPFGSHNSHLRHLFSRYLATACGIIFNLIAFLKH